MFKRVNRRIEKRKQEEELSLDSEMKEVLGLNDTDTDESDSASDLGQDSDDSLPVPSDGEEPEAEEAEGQEGDSPLDESEAEIEKSPPPMSAADALTSPTYSNPKQPSTFLCILCTQKLIFSKELESHLNSKAGFFLGPSTLIRLISSPKNIANRLINVGPIAIGII
ncbi:hypothetical protein BOTBODRAFT_170427 [Botryobasidium botryosum FD-172 SS1]|uniref:Uncharacterized protein n=1 Tax=Botryobasidium botryosum (strain FD-172 SS1) TaxID=930990 RepID=A0A067MXD0_BOTB1|nr:hypothetical protein BOTBODRAFT_170427 [Botryobasidium botryosum FD-172 SS1]